MKVLVLGANGKTGSLVVEHAVMTGHEVSVLVRRADISAPSGVRVFTGNALTYADVLLAMNQQDAVIECIGGTAPWKKQKLEQDVMKNIVAAMEKSGTRRLVVVSAMGVGDSSAQSPWWYQYLVVPTFLRGSTADKTMMEAIVKASQLDWIISRPPILKDGPATGKARMLEKKATGHEITRADLATWLVEQLQSDAYIRQTVVVANN